MGPARLHPETLRERPCMISHGAPSSRTTAHASCLGGPGHTGAVPPLAEAGSRLGAPPLLLKPPACLPAGRLCRGMLLSLPHRPPPSVRRACSIRRATAHAAFVPPSDAGGLPWPLRTSRPSDPRAVPWACLPAGRLGQWHARTSRPFGPAAVPACRLPVGRPGRLVRHGVDATARTPPRGRAMSPATRRRRARPAGAAPAGHPSSPPRRSRPWLRRCPPPGPGP